MRALGYKAGIGTSSRILEIGGEEGTIGVLVQSNFGGRLTVNGIKMDKLDSSETESHGASIMVLIATDLPLSNRLLNRLSKRSSLGMARVQRRTRKRRLLHRLLHHISNPRRKAKNPCSPANQ